MLDIKTAQGRIERGKKLIGRVHLGVRWGIKECGFSCVGVTHYGDGGNIGAFARGRFCSR